MTLPDTDPQRAADTEAVRVHGEGYSVEARDVGDGWHACVVFAGVPTGGPSVLYAPSREVALRQLTEWLRGLPSYAPTNLRDVYAGPHTEEMPDYVVTEATETAQDVPPPVREALSALSERIASAMLARIGGAPPGELTVLVTKDMAHGVVRVELAARDGLLAGLRRLALAAGLSDDGADPTTGLREILGGRTTPLTEPEAERLEAEGGSVLVVTADKVAHERAPFVRSLMQWWRRGDLPGWRFYVLDARNSFVDWPVTEGTTPCR